MNIVTIYWLWTWWKQSDKKLLKYLVIIASLLILCTEAFYNVRNRGKSFENHLPAFSDPHLTMPSNQWITRNDLTRYQAFIPLPYFHIGSENIWIDGGCDIINQSLITIKNSGMPCMGTMLSRTSLSQTMENISLMLGSSCDAIHINRFPSHKPFLLMSARCDQLSFFEKQLISHAQWIDSSGKFDLYELPFDAFSMIADSTSQEIRNEFKSLKLYERHGDPGPVTLPGITFL